eukprot:439365_1
MLGKMSPQFGDYLKLAIYSSGIAFATIGYIFNKKNKSSRSVLYNIYYPLLLQYPATLDLYYGLVSKTNHTTRRVLIATSFVSSIIIPLFHSRIHFANPEKYETKQLLTRLFNPFDNKFMSNAYFYAFSCLSLSQFYSYFVTKYTKNAMDTKMSIEKTIYVKCAIAAVGLVFDKLIEKMKSMLLISVYNPPLTYNEINLFNPKHNYAMYILFDLDKSVLPLEIGSLCIEYSTGTGFITIDNANTSLSKVLYDCYRSKIYRMKELLPNEDTRFVDEFCAKIQQYKSGDNMIPIARLWIKNTMTPLHSAKPIYAGILCLTTTFRGLSDIKQFIK